MKRDILSLLAATALLASTVVAADSAPATTPAPKPQKRVLVHTLKGVEANDEFQHNVQVLQAERQIALSINSQMEKEKDPAKKKELQAKLDAAMKKLNEDNATMAKAYGFSLTRNYVLEIQEANVYLLVSDEEAAKIEAQQKEQKEKAAKAKK